MKGFWEALIQFWTLFFGFWKDIIIKIIDKINIVYILLALVLWGVFSDNRVFVWFDHIAKSFKNIIP